MNEDQARARLQDSKRVQQMPDRAGLRGRSREALVAVDARRRVGRVVGPRDVT
jgi:hypothetical protein